MLTEKYLHVIDTHTLGEPTRIIVSGAPRFKGASVMEKKRDMEANHDWIRKVQIYEPRGHLNMYGALLLEASHPDADYGVIFTNDGGYLNMCGHGIIGVCTMLVEMGYVPKEKPYTSITLEVPAGLVKTKVKISHDQVESVSFINVPSFVYKRNCPVDLPGFRQVFVDIVFAGSFFALVSAHQLKSRVRPEDLKDLVPLALELRRIINETIPVKHPTLPVDRVDLVEVYDEPGIYGANTKNVVIFGAANVDRSPDGGGTSAKLALLYEDGKISLHEPFVHEGILGTTFEGEILGETKIQNYKAITSQITGSAYITGFNQLIVDEQDPFKHGFFLEN
jgi:proline racemase